MLAKRLIPCLDVAAGRVVKGVNFVDLQDAGNPVEIAKRYDESGADELILLDITASHEQRRTLLDLVERVASEVFLPLTIGGGVTSLEDIRDLLQAGADKVSINTAAIKDPELVQRSADHFGSQCIVVAIDAKAAWSKKNHWQVYTHGGRKITKLDAVLWAIRVAELGAGELLITSMDRDGTELGFDTKLLKEISQAVPCPVIASGGAGRLEHLVDAIRLAGVEAVLAASIFHYGKFTIAQAKEFMAREGILMRPYEDKG